MTGAIIAFSVFFILMYALCALVKRIGMHRDWFDEHPG